MEFNPNNRIVKLCLQGMQLEETGQLEAAGKLFLQAWDMAVNDFEKFMAAWFVARRQRTCAGKLQWYETALQLAIRLDNDAVRAAFPALHARIAACCEELGESERAEQQQELALATVSQPVDSGPFYHGTRANLKVGDQLTGGRRSNYQPELLMNHVYFTALVNGAGLAAALAAGQGRERVYRVEPVGSFEDDPNVTNQKFPGNPTRSYRTLEPLRIVGEETEWLRQTPEQLQEWREKLAANQGEIIN